MECHCRSRFRQGYSNFVVREQSGQVGSLAKKEERREKLSRTYLAVCRAMSFGDFLRVSGYWSRVQKERNQMAFMFNLCSRVQNVGQCMSHADIDSSFAPALESLCFMFAGITASKFILIKVKAIRIIFLIL